MDTKTFEDLVVTRTLHASKCTDLPTFGINISRDILRAVTGEPRDTSLSKRLSGADALVLGTPSRASELPKMLSDILDAFSEETYKDNFAWIDHLFSDGTYRDRVRAQIESSVDQTEGDKWLALVPAGNANVERSRYTVSYAVITNSEKPGADWLPFFSKLNLMQQGK
jgi:hypothetical protein